LGSERAIEVDPASPVPLYYQIEKALEGQIESDVLREGDQLPSERELAEQLGVSRMTIRQAVRSLVLAGYCYRIRGKGIFVRRRRVFINTERFEGFTAAMERAGRHSRTVGLGSSVTDPLDWVREGLELNHGERTVELVRLRLLDDEPAILETEWFSERRYAGMIHEDLSQSLYGILETRYATRIAHTADLLMGYMPSREECALLRLPEDTPVIARDRIGSVADGRPVEAVRSIYNGAQFEFRMNLVRETL
jgi:GntR family transcriptional regulator